jgi:hypothetical protein
MTRRPIYLILVRGVPARPRNGRAAYMAAGPRTGAALSFRATIFSSRRRGSSSCTGPARRRVSPR